MLHSDIAIPPAFFPALGMVVTLWCGTNTTESVHAQAADLFTELTGPGLVFTGANGVPQPVHLPASTLSADMSDAQRTPALERLAGKLEWNRFVRDAVTAPVMVDIEAIDAGDGERLGLLVHNAFVAHATLDTLHDSELMQQLFGRPSSNQESAGVVTEELSSEELSRLGFAEPAASSDSFAYLELPLLNQVIVRGVIRIQKRQRAGAIEFAWRLDERFNSVEKYASRWTKLERNEVGKLFEGESFPYAGFGGWLGAYQLQVDEPSPLLIESQMLLREPTEWFAGSNFLRSKLPLSLQENARTFRRKLQQPEP